MNPTSTATPAASGGTTISATKVSGAGTRIGGTKNTEAGWAALRAKRDALLALCDWTQVPDSPIDVTARLAWTKYRQALRDMTKAGHIAKATWPAPPPNPASAAAAQLAAQKAV